MLGLDPLAASIFAVNIDVALTVTPVGAATRARQRPPNPHARLSGGGSYECTGQRMSRAGAECGEAVYISRIATLVSDFAPWWLLL